MDWAGAVPAAMRPVRVCSALRTTGERRATPSRWWVQPEIPGVVSGLNRSQFATGLQKLTIVSATVPELKVKSIFVQILLALHHCHHSFFGEWSLLLRDIKPENGER
jgi:hypothetical protein